MENINFMENFFYLETIYMRESFKSWEKCIIMKKKWCVSDCLHPNQLFFFSFPMSFLKYSRFYTLEEIRSQAVSPSPVVGSRVRVSSKCVCEKVSLKARRRFGLLATWSFSWVKGHLTLLYRMQVWAAYCCLRKLSVWCPLSVYAHRIPHMCGWGWV